MAELFDLCVGAMYLMSDITGLTYKEINIWLFVIIHPVITLTLFILLILKQRKINHYEKTYEMEWGQVEDLVMPESIQKEIDEYDYEAACLQAEIEEAREKDEFFTVGDDGCLDFGPPTYEDLVDPEFDRGFNMAYDKAIGDIMNYLEDGKNYILIDNIRNYLQGLRDSDDKWSI